MQEKNAVSLPGVPVLLVLLAVLVISCVHLINLANTVVSPVAVFATGGVLVLAVFFLTGFFIVQPNQGVVLQFFGR